MWWATWCGTEEDCLDEPRGTEADAWPDRFAYNIGWNAYDDGLGVAFNITISAYTFGGLSGMEGGILEVDPSIDVLSTPPYGNPAGGAGVDAGDLDSEWNDPDGTRNDVGAYGGPNGDWWKESPWLTRL